MDFFKWFARNFIPEDRATKGGYGPFTLPERCFWMEAIFAYHDHYYEVGPECDMRLSEVDVRIAKALMIEATRPDLDWMEQAHRIKDICRYWPIMRTAGHYLYGRHYKRNNI